jgi:DNA primase
MALHQANAGNAIATCGTSLTEGHAKLLHRFCKHVILFRDGDKAGLRATVTLIFVYALVLRLKCDLS